MQLHRAPVPSLEDSPVLQGEAPCGSLVSRLADPGRMELFTREAVRVGAGYPRAMFLTYPGCNSRFTDERAVPQGRSDPGFGSAEARS